MADLLAAVTLTSHASETEDNAAHGLLVGWRDPSKSKEATPAFTHIPLCLLPMQFPRTHFEHGVKLSALYGRLVDRISRDVDWLHSCVQGVVTEDAFTARLLELSRLVHQEGVQQKAYLGLHRSDYMLHEPQIDSAGDSQRLLQVELNTISSSFACISSLVSDMHRFLISRFGAEIPGLEKYYGITSSDFQRALPQNDAINELPNALAAAHKHYGVDDAVVTFVVQPNEANAIDQRWIEYNLWEHHKVRVLRRTLAEVNAHGKLVDRNGNRTLELDGREVSVVYFRSAYTPSDYPTEHEWAARTLIERSYAIKCPSIAYHLAGTKKVQQVLSQPTVLRRFMSEEEAQELEMSFTELYGLEKESATVEDIKRMAITNPHSYVLKPQREGGGNNLYGDEVAAALKTMSSTELESYILMKRIFPKEVAAVLVRNNVTSSGPTISELGMFITSLFDSEGKEILNKHAGHLLRTKLSSTNEGGVATGFSVVSSPLLI
ncbi:glutathione synthetase [Plasmopara halstedii]|uniref:Glutathione synthetase n=1 Tax=Plasmopara halstedii TaxID=4781 RepID=A0A0P1AV14_PLAHL|nr:glutathione synthetase [Plasmopara halstedii]CEG46252.1 glutathione synthetase [Plasmopara halstedii]|eukprot:XP_024582621.1 glutathione synthetase [Plasmopara halstedii]